MPNLLAGRINLVPPCHTAPLRIVTTLEGHGHLASEVPSEIYCSAGGCTTEWDRVGGGVPPLVTPCHGAELLIITALEGHGHLARDVPDEILCSCGPCLNSWDPTGIADEWNTADGTWRIDNLEDIEAEAEHYADSHAV